MKNWIAPLIVLAGLIVYLVALRGDRPGAETKESFAQAATQYEQGKFARAEETYQKLIADGQTSSAIYYNLALTQGALEKPGQAIFHLEKAAQLDPGSSEISTKLAELRKNNGSTETTQLSFWQTIPVSSATIAGALAVLALALLPLSRLLNFPYAPTVMTTVICLLVIGVSAYSLHDHDQRTANRAIIVSSETPLRISPFDGAETLQDLAPGQTVKIVEDKTHDNFRLVETENGKTGWVLSKEVETLLN